jgi:hypothetical protein
MQLREWENGPRGRHGRAGFKKSVLAAVVMSGLSACCRGPAQWRRRATEKEKVRLRLLLLTSTTFSNKSITSERSDLYHERPPTNPLSHTYTKMDSLGSMGVNDPYDALHSTRCHRR